MPKKIIKLRKSNDVSILKDMKNGLDEIIELIEQFKDSGLKSASDKKHGLDLEKMAMDKATSYKQYKDKQKTIGNLDYAKIPCVNLPVFKG